MGDSNKQIRRNIHKAILLVAVGCVTFSLLVIAAWYGPRAFFKVAVPRYLREELTDPVGEFEAVTGLSCPLSAQIILAKDTHGGLHGDGKTCIALEVQRDVAVAWLNSPPPWNCRQWKHGPVPTEIGIHCNMPTRPLYAASKKYRGDKQLRDLLGSPDIWFVARERGPSNSNIPWHNGNLLVIAPEIGAAWLFVWDC
ncbi:MAG: hypothetical protein ACQESR_18430 [Planctomycetota bacterium]